MNKNELAARVAQDACINKQQAVNAITALLRTVTESVAAGEEVRLPDFGTFSAKQKAARTVYSPQTGEPVRVPARRVPSFKAGKAFKAAVAE